MTKLEQILPTVIAQANPNAPARPSSNPPSNSVTPLMNDNQGKIRLSQLLFEAWEVLNVFGRDPEQMKKINSRFQVALAHHPMSKIEPAIQYYINHCKGFMEPADIDEIIFRGGNKPPFRPELYREYQHKRGEYRTPAEFAYMREYEAYHRGK